MLRRVEYNCINNGSLFKLIGHPLVVKSSSYVDIVFLVRSVLTSTYGSPNLSTDLKLYDWKDLGILSWGKCGKYLTFTGPCIVNVFFKYKQRDATLYNILYYSQCCKCFRRFLCPSSGAQKLYTQHRVYVELVCSLDIYPMLCLHFLSSWWWAEKPPERCRALRVIKNIV